MKTRNRGWALISVLCLSLLSACGGGGGDAPASTPAAPTNPNPSPVASANSFALAAGYKARLIAGANDNFDITGDCTGTANITIERTTAAPFEGSTVIGARQTASSNLSCAPPSNPTTGFTYYNANYSPIGLSVDGGDYAVFAAPPIDLLTSVTVDNVERSIVTYNVYSNSSKATLVGTRVISYKIEPDTTTTAIFNLITKSYNTNNLLLSTQQSRYKMAADGTLTLLTIEVVFVNTAVLRLVYTKK